MYQNILKDRKHDKPVNTTRQSLELWNPKQIFINSVTILVLELFTNTTSQQYGHRQFQNCSISLKTVDIVPVYNIVRG